MATQIPRPGTDEYAPFYNTYVSLVPDGDLILQLRAQLTETLRMFREPPADRADFAYAAGKWTVREVLGHVIDAERVFQYRVLRFARADATPLAGFDEKAYVPQGGFGRRTIADLLDELEAVRASTIHLAKHLDAESLARRGVANDREITVRALLYVIAGHERHHRALLRERYGV